MSDDAGVCVAVDVGFPLPTRCVWVAGADVLGLKPLEFLLGTKFVRLGFAVSIGRVRAGGVECGPTIMRLEFEYCFFD